MFDSVLRKETLPRRRFGAGTFLGAAVYAGVAAFAFWAQSTAKGRDRQDVAVTFVKPPPREEELLRQRVRELERLCGQLSLDNELLKRALKGSRSANATP